MQESDKLPEGTGTRRHLLKGAGMLFGGGGAIAALATPALADNADPSDIAGLWTSVVSAQDHSFPSFAVIALWGDKTFIGSGQTDLTPALLESSAWGRWTKLGDRTFSLTARFWTYGPGATPNGFATINLTYTLSRDGKNYHGVGPLQFFDNSGSLLGPATTILDDGVRAG